jgi:hypothetical protein
MQPVVVVSIRACLAVLSPMAFRDQWKALLCSCEEGRHPGVPGNGILDACAICQAGASRAGLRLRAYREFPAG